MDHSHKAILAPPTKDTTFVEFESIFVNNVLNIMIQTEQHSCFWGWPMWIETNRAFHFCSRSSAKKPNFCHIMIEILDILTFIKGVTSQRYERLYLYGEGLEEKYWF